jgi:hypothetical protein
MIGRWRDDADRVLKRSQISQSGGGIDTVYADGFLVAGPPAIQHVVNIRFFGSSAYFGLGFALDQAGSNTRQRIPIDKRYRSRSQAGQRRTLLQETSAIRLLGTHDENLLNKSLQKPAFLSHFQLIFGRLALHKLTN